MRSANARTLFAAACAGAFILEIAGMVPAQPPSDLERPPPQRPTTDGSNAPRQPLAGEIESALEPLRALTPPGQAAALAEMRRARRAGTVGPAQIPLIAAIVEDPAWTVVHRRQAGWGLALLGEDAKSTLERWASSTDGPLSEIGRDALRFHTLAAPLTAKRADDRLASVKPLVAHATAHPETLEFAVEALGAAYGRPDEPRRDVRLAALRGLLQLGATAAPELVASLQHADPLFYQYGRAALQALGDDARGALLDGLQHRHPLVRQRAIFLLHDAGLDDESAAAIRPLLNDRDELVRKAAAKALSSQVRHALRE